MTKAPIKKPQTDWEAIEREFRAGQLSLRQIGAAYGVTEGAIRKRAKNDRWQRDLTDRVRQSVRQGLLRHDADGTQPGTQSSTHANPVAKPPRRHTEAADRAIVDSAAARGVDVVLRHRRDADRLRAIHDRVMTSLEMLAGVGEPQTDGVEAVDASEKALSAINGLAAAAKITIQIIGIERQAFNLDDPDPGGTEENPIATLRAQLQGTAFKPTALTGGADRNG